MFHVREKRGFFYEFLLPHPLLPDMVIIPVSQLLRNALGRKRTTGSGLEVRIRLKASRVVVATAQRENLGVYQIDRGAYSLS